MEVVVQSLSLESVEDVMQRLRAVGSLIAPGPKVKPGFRKAFVAAMRHNGAPSMGDAVSITQIKDSAL